MRRLIFWMAMALVQTGCASFQDWHYECVNCFRSQFAWYTSDYDRQSVQPFHDFGCGWRHGYCDVSQGRCGRAPAIPPKDYWSAHYQSPRGAAAISAWYQGYQEGALAAERAGFGSRAALSAYGPGQPIMRIGPAIEPADMTPDMSPVMTPLPPVQLRVGRGVEEVAAPQANQPQQSPLPATTGSPETTLAPTPVLIPANTPSSVNTPSPAIAPLPVIIPPPAEETPAAAPPQTSSRRNAGGSGPRSNVSTPGRAFPALRLRPAGPPPPSPPDQSISKTPRKARFAKQPLARKTAIVGQQLDLRQLGAQRLDVAEATVRRLPPVTPLDGGSLN